MKVNITITGGMAITNEDYLKKKYAMCGHPLANIGKPVFAKVDYDKIDRKCTGRKSDRKRNRANRWR